MGSGVRRHRCNPNSKIIAHELVTSTITTMASLARRSILTLTRQSPRVCRPIPTLYRPSHRPFTVSHTRLQTPLETPAVAEEPVAGLNDAPVFLDDDTTQVDWSRSFHGLSSQPFSEEASKVLTAPLDVNDVEIKPGPSSHPWQNFLPSGSEFPMSLQHL